MLSLALKYEGCSLMVGCSIVGIFDLLFKILDSFNILDVIKDGNKLLSSRSFEFEILRTNSDVVLRFKSSGIFTIAFDDSRSS
jgi:hypothetical protein